MLRKQNKQLQGKDEQQRRGIERYTQIQAALAESEARFRSLIQESPVTTLVYVGADMVMQVANELMLEIFGRVDAVLGKPSLEAVPELKDTELPARYRRVLATGETHYQYAERILLIKNGQPYWSYYDYIYKALRDPEGDIYGVICTATDITPQVRIQRHRDIESGGKSVDRFHIVEVFVIH